MGAPITWFEINSSDPKGARDFHGDVFGWTFQVLEQDDYGLVDTRAEGAIGGGIGRARDPESGHRIHRAGRPADGPRPHRERRVCSPRRMKARRAPV
jgi:hypothetical protein